MQKFLVLFLSTIFIFFINQKGIANTNAFNTKAKTAIVIEATTGKVLFNKNAYETIYPASLTKLMTLYIIFDQLKQKYLSLDTIVTVSSNAYYKGGSKTGSSTMFLLPNQKVTVENLIHGIATLSGNDASIAMAETIAGSESQFTNYMNIYAKKIGLTNSHFINATGWPDTNHYSTAYDISIICQRLILDFPEYYHFFNVPEFTFNNITQSNRNNLLFDKSIMVDGFKTGHTLQAGYNLAFSAKNLCGSRIIGVVDGLESNKERTEESKKLLSWVFFNLSYKNIFKKGDLITTIPVWYGSPSSLKIYSSTDIKIFYNKNYENLTNYKVILKHNNILLPPIKKGDIIANLIIQNTQNENDIYIYNLKSNIDIKKSNFLVRFIKLPYYLIKKIFM